MVTRQKKKFCNRDINAYINNLLNITVNLYQNSEISFVTLAKYNSHHTYPLETFFHPSLYAGPIATFRSMANKTYRFDPHVCSRGKKLEREVSNDTVAVL